MPHITTTPTMPGPVTRATEIVVNYRHVRIPRDTTGSQIVAAAGLPLDFRLFRIDGRSEIPIAPDEQIRLEPHERFVACPTLDPALLANPAHAGAVSSVRDAFPGHDVDIDEPGDGTVVITVRAVDIGPGWNLRVIDLTVKLQVTFPSSPPYPFYGPAGMARTDGRAFPQIQQQVPFDGGTRTQISLNKPFDPATETLAGRLVGVIAWLRSPR
jgi:hypothetical protein